MPELPEVETLRRGLAPQLEGHRIRRVELRRRDLRIPVPEDFESRITGARFERLRRRGKYLFLDLSNGATILVHLGMSGHLFVLADGAAYAPRKHDHAELWIEDRGRLIFNDARRFGLLDLLVPGGEENDPRLAALGPDPLGNDFSAPALKKALSRRRGPVKPALLDQRLIAGIGNIYASEALFRAGVSPRRKCRNVSARKTEDLVGAIRAVLSDAIESGGSSLRDFVAADGSPGYFQHRFEAYGRVGKTCLRSGCGGTIRQIVQAGRASYYCGGCQR